MITIPANVSSGPVEVRVPTGVGTLTGNAVPLTSWSGTARFKEIVATFFAADSRRAA